MFSILHKKINAKASKEDIMKISMQIHCSFELVVYLTEEILFWYEYHRKILKLNDFSGDTLQLVNLLNNLIKLQ